MKKQSYKFLTEADFQKEVNSVSNTLKQYLKNVAFDSLEIELSNAMDENVIIQAVKRNEIFYTQDEVFVGNLKSRVISALQTIGAIYNRNLQGYYIPFNFLSDELRMAIRNTKEQRKSTFTTLLNAIDKNLATIGLASMLLGRETTPAINNIEKVLNNEFNTNVLFTRFIKEKEKEAKEQGRQFSEKDVKKEWKEKQQDPLFSQSFRDEYTSNLQLKIKSVAEEKLIKLRQELEQAQREGKTITNLQDVIKQEIDVSNSRAEFISKQEARLFTANYQIDRCKKSGTTKFKWIHTDPTGARTDPRTGHVMLAQRSNEGEVYDLNNPPIDPITGEPTLPGKEYNCNCKASIVLEIE